MYLCAERPKNRGYLPKKAGDRPQNHLTKEVVEELAEELLGNHPEHDEYKQTLVISFFPLHVEYAEETEKFLRWLLKRDDIPFELPEVEACVEEFLGKDPKHARARQALTKIFFALIKSRYRSFLKEDVEKFKKHHLKTFWKTLLQHMEKPLASSKK